MRSVVPRLTQGVKSLEVDPSDQKVEPLSDLFSWIGVIDIKVIAQILREHLFGKWIKTLQEWLDTADDNDETFEEILQWYQGWKAFMPLPIMELSQVEEVFKIAMQLIHSKVQ